MGVGHRGAGVRREEQHQLFFILVQHTNIVGLWGINETSVLQAPTQIRAEVVGTRALFLAQGRIKGPLNETKELELRASFTLVNLSRPSSFRRVTTVLSRLNSSFTARASPTGTRDRRTELSMGQTRQDED